ncbi:hypothetical protein Scep_010467 [Stephania cephalantha]|uniref:GAG-pre-integrase domain-containing protein n=1 Tax=Stephania cephalantha TaxID=152367 RepID=A0AAP0PH98_9MAGN
MCPNRDWFFSFQALDGGTVYMGNDHAFKTKGISTIKLKVHDGTVRELTDVRYMPDLKKNLISVGALESKGFKIIIEAGVMKVVLGALVVLKGIRLNNLYFLKRNTVVGGATTFSNAVVDDTTRLWHIMRLGHASKKALQGLVKQGLLKDVKVCKLKFCEHCVLGKQTLVKFGSAVHQTRETLDYVHSNVWGPAKNTSLGGNRYFVTFVDDYSRRVWCIL